MYFFKHYSKWIVKEIKGKIVSHTVRKWVHTFFHDIIIIFHPALWIIVAYASGRWNEIWHCPAERGLGRFPECQIRVYYNSFFEKKNTLSISAIFLQNKLLICCRVLRVVLSCPVFMIWWLS